MARRTPLDHFAVVRDLLRMRRNDPAHYDDEDGDLDFEVLHDGAWYPGVLERWRKENDQRWVGFVRSSGAGHENVYWVNREHIRTANGTATNGERSFPERETDVEGLQADDPHSKQPEP